VRAKVFHVDAQLGRHTVLSLFTVVLCMHKKGEKKAPKP